MTSFRIQLGLVPKTVKIEADRTSLEKEYHEYLQYKQSDEYKEYLELFKFVDSENFMKEKEKIEQQKFSETKEYQLEKEYIELGKDKEIADYYRYINSQAYKFWDHFKDAEKLEEYYQLKKQVESDELQSVKKYYTLPGEKRFEGTEQYELFKKYKALHNLPDVNAYNKFFTYKGVKDFLELNNSEEIKHFYELESFVRSREYEESKSSMKKKDFAKTEAFQKFREYQKSLKTKRFKNYFKLLEKPETKVYIKTEGSENIKTYEELKKYVHSEEFKNKKKEVVSKKYEHTPEYQTEKSFHQLKKDKELKKYFRILESALHKNYEKLHKSKKQKHYEDLKSKIESEDFRQVKTYMLLSPKKKYLQSELHSKKVRFDELRHSEKIKWCLHAEKTDKFHSLEAWSLTFEDDFTGNKLDPKKWLTRYFWGNYFLNESYSLASDKQFITDGENLKIENSVLSIITKKKAITGKAWDTKRGFYPRDFEYTSGLINTGNSFRQKYGLFEAKIKLQSVYPVFQAFWMLSDKMLPHVEVVKKQKRTIMQNIWQNGGNKYSRNLQKIFSTKYTGEFFIYSLLWTEDALTWKINDVVVRTVKTGIPQDPMYLIFSAGLEKDIAENKLPVTMEIDWIRCYQKN